MDFEKKYIKYKLKYLNSKNILNGGSEKVSGGEKESENDCLFIAQGNRGFCWLASSIIVLYKLMEKGIELKKELEDFVHDTLIQFEKPEKFDNSCPIIPKSLGLTYKLKEVFTEELEFISNGSKFNVNFNDPNIFKILYPSTICLKKKQFENNESVPPEIEDLYFGKEFNQLTIDDKVKINLILSNNLKNTNYLKIKIIKDNGSIFDPSKVEFIKLIRKIKETGDVKILLDQNEVQKITLEPLADQIDTNYDNYKIDADYLIIITNGKNTNNSAVLNFRLTKKYKNDGYSPFAFIENVLEKSDIKMDNNAIIEINTSEDLKEKINTIQNIKFYNYKILNSFNKIINEFECIMKKYQVKSELLDNMYYYRLSMDRVFSYLISCKNIRSRRDKRYLLLLLEKISLVKDKAVGTIIFDNINYSEGHAIAFYYCEEIEKVVYCEPNSNESVELNKLCESEYIKMDNIWLISNIYVLFINDNF
jgi:hypothetical protein